MTHDSTAAALAARSLAFLFAVPLAATGAMAQADAQKAFQEARVHYDKGEFAPARDLLIQAALTDSRNPEVFLWLGRAHYQLGDLDAALAAWTTTLRLAPDEPYATRMIAALRGGSQDVGARTRLVEVLVQDGLLVAAADECGRLLRDRALSTGQRSRVRQLQAEIEIERVEPAAALAILRELQAADAEASRAPASLVLLGRAGLQSQDPVAGLQTLRSVLADHAGTAAAVDAELAILTWQLGQTPGAEGAIALARWIDAHAGHPRLGRARQSLVEAWLATVERGEAPRASTVLDEAVKSAFSAARSIFEVAGPRAGLQLTERLLEFVQSHYGHNGAFQAAVDGVALLLQQPLSQSGRRLALGAMAQHQVNLAFVDLTRRAEAGGWTGVEVPEPLAAALQTFATIVREFPSQPAWEEQAMLAERAQGLAAAIPWPEPVTQPRAPSAWAADIALPIVASAQGKPRDRAVTTVLQIVRELQPKSAAAALTVLARLLALPELHDHWQAATLLQVELLAELTQAEFLQNVQRGADAANAGLGDRQRQLVAALGQRAQRSTAMATSARQWLGAHLQRWIEHGHFALAEQSWRLLLPSLPATEQRRVELEIARLWGTEVQREHQRLQAVGLAVPRQLDPRLARALQQLYLLQEGTAESFAAEVRGTWDGIVDHYRALQYFDIAEQALQVRADRAVAPADEYAELQRARLQTELAVLELSRRLARHDGQRRIEVTPAFRIGLDGYLGFLKAHPSSTLAPHAVDGILQIARTFEQHGAFPPAAQVLGEFAAAAQRIPLTAQADPGGSSAAQRASLGRARALDAEARKALAEQLVQQAPDAPPPPRLSEQFAAAVAAYREFLVGHPGSVLVGDALAGIMAIGLEYARVGAWEVADSIYTDLLAAGLALEHPEQLAFASGLCKLGPSMADHVRAVLQAMLLGARPPQSEPAPADPDAKKAEVTEAFRSVLFLGGATRPEGTPAAAQPRFDAGDDVLQTIRRQEANQAAAVAMLRDQVQARLVPGQQDTQPPALTAAELARLRASIDAAYQVFLGILRSHPDNATATQARSEILVMVDHWRSLAQWHDAARLAERFLQDQPDDRSLPQLRLAIARDWLALAAAPVEPRSSVQEMLVTVGERFDVARAALGRIVDEFARQRELVHQAQWDVARSWWTQAQVVAAFSPTLARGQYVRASRELQRVAATCHDHPDIGQIPEMLWNLTDELVGRAFLDEAIQVLDDLTVRYPTHPRADPAQLRIAQLYQQQAQPLRAAEAYQELNFARGGQDQQLQDAILQIGLQLQGQRRWVEALFVLETFVDSFPTHANADQALTLLGNIHQTNEAWEDAIAAYRRVLSDHPRSEHVKAARWSIAECVINLSRWSEAIDAYRDFIRLYPKDDQSGEANNRIAILKDLERYQKVVDEQGQRKAFDAQFQIAAIVRERLANPVKAIIEFGRVKDRWPDSHLADDALYEVGATQLSLGNTERARTALMALASDYPGSPLADDALYLVGRSFEEEASALTSVTRAQSVEKAKESAQKRAFSLAQDERRRQSLGRGGRIAELKQQGQVAAAEREEASNAAYQGFFLNANVGNFAQWAEQEAATLTATEFADRQDKVDAALRRAVQAYATASGKAGGDKAGDALLAMAKIQHDLLKDVDAALATWLEIVRQFSGTAVAEDASWQIAQYHEQAHKHKEAVEAYEAFLRNYRRSPKAGDAQIAIAENHEQLGNWVNAMDAYTNYINNFPSGPRIDKAREQIQWIKTYRL
ncbi:MAG: tetratricopeptide repeat protein [Planctomycetes bacterium]|nr:tetratricopeptide repeat protein [Planctomycetota bacterium]